MMIRAILSHDGHAIDRYEFEIHAQSDFAKGAGAAYEHFCRNHPGLQLSSDGVEVRFGKP